MKPPIEILSDLKDKGLTDSEIAAMANSTQPTIWRIRTGVTSDCGAILYASLLKLHGEYKRKKRAKK